MEKIEKCLAEIKEWANDYPSYLSNREGYARGYREAMFYAKEVVQSIIAKYGL